MSDVGSMRNTRDLGSDPGDGAGAKSAGAKEGEVLAHRPAPGAGLIDVLEERVGGLVDRYRGAQKSSDELRLRLDAAEAEISALHARVEESDRLRGALRERIQLLIEQVRRLEGSAAVAAAASEESGE